MSYKANRLAQLAAFKERPSRPGPERVIWQVTRACDLCCRPCRSLVLAHSSPGELDSNEALDLIEQIRRIGQPELLLTGGDPLKRPDLGLLVLYANRLGLPVSLTLSGTPRTTPRLVGLLKAAGLSHITFCLDGARAEVHDSFRGEPGSFGWTLDGIRVAQGIGLPIQIESSVTPCTLPQLDDLAVYVGTLGAKAWQVTFGGRPERDPGGSLSLEEYGKAIEKLAALQGTVNYRVRVTPAAYFAETRGMPRCAVAWQPVELFISDDGTVERWNSGEILGNLRERPFAELVSDVMDQPQAAASPAG